MIVSTFEKEIRRVRLLYINIVKLINFVEFSLGIFYSRVRKYNLASRGPVGYLLFCDSRRF